MTKSVVQGSWLASWLYNVYTLDVGRLVDVMKDRELCKTPTNKDIPEDNNNYHSTKAYVDDVTLANKIN